MFAVHFALFDLKIFAQTLRNGVTRFDDPHPFFFRPFTPLEGAIGRHHTLENLGEVSGVQADQPHTFDHTLLNPVHDLVGNITVLAVTPPEKHIRVVQNFLCQTVFRHIQRSCGDIEVSGFVQRCSHCRMDPLRVNPADPFFGLLVPIFIPDGNIDLSVVHFVTFP